MSGWKDIDGGLVSCGSPGMIGCIEIEIKHLVERPEHLPRIYNLSIRDAAKECTPENKHIADKLNLLGDEIMAAWIKFEESTN